MKPRVLVTRRLPEPALARLSASCEVEVNPADRPMSREELLARVAGAAALVSLLTDRVDAEVMAAAGATLKVVANYAAGYDNVDVAEATRRGVAVTNTPDVLTETTADLAWALMLDASRRVSEGDRIVRRGEFRGWAPLFMAGHDVHGATLGIYGFGRIGRAVAARARGFSMRVLYHDEARADPETERMLGAAFTDFEGLLRESDIISIHCPLTPMTRHRFALKEFSAMKRTARLVNTARGPVVKEDDLAEALRRGLIAGAGLDVYEAEPAVDPGLKAAPTAVLAPHLGSATAATREAMAMTAAESVLDALAGRRPSACLNPSVYGGTAPGAGGRG
jgi:glyoxylate reductase